MARGLSDLQKQLLAEAKKAGEDGIRPCLIVQKRFDKLPKDQRNSYRRLLLTIVIGKSLRRLARRGLLQSHGGFFLSEGNGAVRYRYAARQQ